MNIKIDARVRYTKMVIRETFLKLLSEKELAKITVSEICTEANINRATFYRYYENPSDLLNKLEAELYDRLEEKLRSVNAEDLSQVFQIVLTDILEDFDFYRLLLSENGDEGFRDRVFTLCYSGNMATIRTLFPNMSPAEQELLYYFVAEGCNGILKRWIEGGGEMPIDELVRFTGKLVIGINRELPAHFS